MNAVAGSRGEKKAKPPVKWAGGKGQMLEQFGPLFPRRGYSLYLEPFAGGGAVFFHLAPSRAVLMDSNRELVNFFRVLRDKPDLLLEDLRLHRNEAGYYYLVRDMDPGQMDEVSRASRFLYLNKTGYNGLWRVNSQGKHNVPFGRYKNPRIADEEKLRGASRALQQAEIICCDFSRVLEFARPGAFVYLDPPYHPLSGTANFTGYTCGAFSEDSQRRLAGVFNALDRGGCLVMLSNSDTPFIRSLYYRYDIREVYGKRVINCKAGKRGPVSELVIRNYSNYKS